MTLLLAFLRGDWLSAARIRAGTRVLLLAEVVVFVLLVLGSHGVFVPLEKPTTTDFVSFYAAGKLALQGAATSAYDQATHFRMEEAVTAPGIGYQYFFYPPVWLLLCAPLALLPYLVSFVLFQAVSLVFLLFVLRRILAPVARGWAVAALAFPPVFWTLGLGQNAFLTAGLMGLGMYLLPVRPFVAGLALGALCYKPHFGLLLPVALLCGRQWWAILGAAVSVLGLVGLSVALFGVETWQAYLTAMGGAPAVYEGGKIEFAGMASVFGGARLLGVPVVMAHGVQVLALVAAVLGVAFLFWRGVSAGLGAASLAVGSLLAVHLALVYDVLLLLLAMAWLVRGGGLKGEKTIFLAIYLALLLVSKWLILRGVAPPPPVPLMPLAVLAMAGLCLRRAVWEWQGGKRGLAGAGRQLL